MRGPLYILDMHMGNFTIDMTNFLQYDVHNSVSVSYFVSLLSCSLIEHPVCNTKWFLVLRTVIGFLHALYIYVDIRLHTLSAA